MLRYKHLIPARIVLGLLAFAPIGFALDVSARAATESVIYSFNGSDGTEPGPLIFDQAGNLYGTAYYGGDATCYDGWAYGCGVVFEVIPNGKGGWTEKTLYAFRGPKSNDGSNPDGGLIFDLPGNLYGISAGGGNHNCAYGGFLCGTVFELTETADGHWSKQVLHYFESNGKDGYNPRAGLVRDKQGNLYGTTFYGGTGSCSDGNGGGCGTVFELSPPRQKGGKWTETILYSFQSENDGVSPDAPLILDASGNLYGETVEGGGLQFLNGTIFELVRKSGKWKEKILHGFSDKDGANPLGGLTFDAAGTLYGTTYYGPPQGYNGPCFDGTDLGCGTIFELKPTHGGIWKERILHHFRSNGKDGYHPSGSLIVDASGNLYGTTSEGGDADNGTAFEFVPKPGGGWTEKILHSFNYDSGKDGTFPAANLILDINGALYGTTSLGGAGNCLVGGVGGCGTVFKITP